MPCKLYLRTDQTGDEDTFLDVSSVVIFSPPWVTQKALPILGEKLKGIKCEVYAPTSKKLIETFTLPENLSLVDLQKIARAESYNWTGVIKFGQYKPDILDRDLIIGLRHLVRHCVIVGKTETTNYGGFKCSVVPQRSPVYVADLSALEFRQKYNSGRFVLICENEEKGHGLFDDLIYSEVVGEKKKFFNDVLGLYSSEVSEPEVKARYERCRESQVFGKCFFDTVAFKRFVALDARLTAFAVSRLAQENNDKLNFKFLKYGTGHFAKEFKSQINKYILDGIITGLEQAFEEHSNVSETIRHLEFPFSTFTAMEETRLKGLKSKYGIEYRTSDDDALKSTVPGLVTATINCASPHSAFGNKIGRGSMDSSIALNIKNKGNMFCPHLNKGMRVNTDF